MKQKRVYNVLYAGIVYYTIDVDAVLTDEQTDNGQKFALFYTVKMEDGHIFVNAVFTWAIMRSSRQRCSYQTNGIRVKVSVTDVRSRLRKRGIESARVLDDIAIPSPFLATTTGKDVRKERRLCRKRSMETENARSPAILAIGYSDTNWLPKTLGRNRICSIRPSSYPRSCSGYLLS